MNDKDMVIIMGLTLISVGIIILALMGVKLAQKEVRYEYRDRIVYKNMYYVKLHEIGMAVALPAEVNQDQIYWNAHVLSNGVHQILSLEALYSVEPRSSDPEAVQQAYDEGIFE